MLSFPLSGANDQQCHLVGNMKIIRTGCGVHFCPLSSTMRTAFSGSVWKNSSVSTPVPSSSSTRALTHGTFNESLTWDRRRRSNRLGSKCVMGTDALYTRDNNSGRVLYTDVDHCSSEWITGHSVVFLVFYTHQCISLRHNHVADFIIPSAVWATDYFTLSYATISPQPIQQRLFLPLSSPCSSGLVVHLPWCPFSHCGQRLWLWRV